MSLNEDIIQKLLYFWDDPTGLEEVFQHHRKSKGPFYLALAESTIQMRHRFDQSRAEVLKLEGNRQRLQKHVETVEEHCAILEDSLETLNQQVEQREAKLSDVRGLLARAEELARLGFGQPELSLLYDSLAQTAGSQGLPPDQGITQFFENLDPYRQIVGLDLEANRAQARCDQARADAQRWEAEARAKEAHSKARSSAIDLTEKLLDQGGRPETCPSRAGYWPRRESASKPWRAA